MLSWETPTAPGMARVAKSTATGRTYFARDNRLRVIRSSDGRLLVDEWLTGGIVAVCQFADTCETAEIQYRAGTRATH